MPAPYGVTSDAAYNAGNYKWFRMTGTQPPDGKPLLELQPGQFLGFSGRVGYA